MMWEIGDDDGPHTGKLLWCTNGIEGWESPKLNEAWKWYLVFVWEEVWE